MAGRSVPAPAARRSRLAATRPGRGRCAGRRPPGPTDPRSDVQAERVDRLLNLLRGAVLLKRQFRMRVEIAIEIGESGSHVVDPVLGQGERHRHPSMALCEFAGPIVGREAACHHGWLTARRTGPARPPRGRRSYRPRNAQRRRRASR